MKKIILFALCVFILMSVFGTICLATEPVIENNTEVAEETNTIFTRIWEFVNKYKGEVLSVVGDTGILTTALYILYKLASNKKITEKDISEVKALASNTVTKQSDLVNGFNKMVDAYNLLAEECRNMQATYVQYEESETERNKAISIVILEINALLEIVSSAYANSKLPQGVKEMVSARYAKCIKAIESDETLLAILKTAQSALNNT